MLPIRQGGKGASGEGKQARCQQDRANNPLLDRLMPRKQRLDGVAVPLLVRLDALHLGERGDQVLVGAGGVVLALGDQPIGDFSAQNAVKERQQNGFGLARFHNLLRIGSKHGTMAAFFRRELAERFGVRGIAHRVRQCVVHENGVELALLGFAEILELFPRHDLFPPGLFN